MSTITFNHFPSPSQHHGQARIEALIALVQRGVARAVPSATVAPVLSSHASAAPNKLSQWLATRRQNRADALTWQLAQSDHRLMAELSLAKSMTE